MDGTQIVISVLVLIVPIMAISYESTSDNGSVIKV